MSKSHLATGQETVLHSFTNGNDGGAPYGSLLYMHGYLFGTTYQAGYCCGTVFKIKP